MSIYEDTSTIKILILELMFCNLSVTLEKVKAQYACKNRLEADNAMMFVIYVRIICRENFDPKTSTKNL